MDYVSASRLALFAECGEKYRRKYVDGDSEPDNLPSVVGSALHSAIEQWEKQHRSTNLYELARTALREYGDLSSLQVWGSKDEAWWFREGLKLQTDSYEQHVQTDTSTVVESERQLHVQLEADLPHLYGYIDQALTDEAGRLFVRDIKTGKDKPAHPVQVELYRIGYEEMVGETVAYSSILYLGEKAKERVYPATLTKPQVARLIRSLAEVDTYPVQGPFTGACVRCSFRADCPWGQVGAQNVLS